MYFNMYTYIIYYYVYNVSIGEIYKNMQRGKKINKKKNSLQPNYMICTVHCAFLF